MPQIPDDRAHDRTDESAPTPEGQDPVRATKPSPNTREAERDDAHVVAGADRPPTDDEERMAPASVSDEQRAHAREMLERGASQQGEGRVG